MAASCEARRMEEDGHVTPEGTSPDCVEGAVVLPIPTDGCFRCTLCTNEYDRVDAISRHTRDHHSTPVMFKCSKCGRMGGNYRSISIHHGKCNGPRPAVSDAALPFACSACERKFVSKLSMTQHKRHAHPAVRNEERLEKLEASKRLPSNRVWSPDEEKNFVRVAKGLTNLTRQIQRALITEFPGKTKTQILNKWKALRRLRLRQQRANQVTTPAEKVQDQEVPVQKPTSRECGHGKVHELKVSWAYVVKTTHRVINRIELSGPPRKVQDRLTSRRASRRRVEVPHFKERKRRFAEVQRLWDLAPDKLATAILDGENTRVTPDLETAEKHFSSLFQTRNDLCGPLEYAGDSKCTKPLEFTPKEVKRVIKGCRLRGASGPDGLRPVSLKRSLKRGVEHELAALFNLWLKFRKVPAFQCAHRTVLIPKAGAQPKDMSTWRPITVGNLLLRLFCSMLAKRLSCSMPICEIQRGFVPCDGIAENNFLFARLLKDGNTSTPETAIVLLDFARAFDSVGHVHLFAALERLGVCNAYQQVFKYLYGVSTTRLQVGGGFSQPIRFERGVMQGNPASTELFKAALDPLICRLQRSGYGIMLRGASQRLGCLGFADDMIVVAESVQGMTEQLAIVSDFCRGFGLELNVRKCKSVLLRRTRDCVVVDTAAKWKVGEEEIPQVSVESTMKYLGVEFTPLRGPRMFDLEGRLGRMIERIGASGTGLKPDQRVALLCTYAVPRLLHQMTYCPVSGVVLDCLDRMIRKAVKEWVKLPPSATDGVLYAASKDGGLAIPKLSSIVPMAKAKSLKRLAASSFAMVTETLAALSEEERSSIWGACRKRKVRGDWRRAEAMGWEWLPVQGVGVQHFLSSNVSNSWLRKPPGMKASTWCRCLQLRTDTYPTRTALTRGREGLRECRLCRFPHETLRHLLSKCPELKGQHIRRHDRIVELLARQCASHGWRVRKEFRCRLNNGIVLVPDLILHDNGGRAIVIDVAITYESAQPDVFELAYDMKAKKYEVLREYLANEGLGETATFHGFILGCRGAFPKINDQVLDDVGIRNWHFKAMLSRRVLQMSVDMLQRLGDHEGSWENYQDVDN
ncbi:Retrovirus-related Pol polyprotein type-1 like protein [Argiope bruennichi]|uniref:Retrovirus-related Pol polyprotein type-1 like protein n=1 Tax=Argiope bruennichi TaxID=94029 RepID=A0A8T0EYZ5_ARGBR|nr:Retrovirus-related Pol polyprotein type-1 like protein [Argiope bruennichi]